VQGGCLHCFFFFNECLLFKKKSERKEKKNTLLLREANDFFLKSRTGGPGKRGKIMEIGTFSGGHYRGGVRVRWDCKPDSQLGYKVGAEGKVDLVAKSKTSGGSYYPEHLPRLGIVFVIACMSLNARLGMSLWGCSIV
jgi:hypothetical protein